MTKILEHLKSFLEKKTRSTCPFDTMLAGTLDLSVRKSDRVYAWDGFRRIMLALLSGVEYMPATISNLTEYNNTESRKVEAYAFKKKNGDSEVRKPEELFKPVTGPGTIFCRFLQQTGSRCFFECGP